LSECHRTEIEANDPFSQDEAIFRSIAICHVVVEGKFHGRFSEFISRIANCRMSPTLIHSTVKATQSHSIDAEENLFSHESRRSQNTRKLRPRSLPFHCITHPKNILHLEAPLLKPLDGHQFRQWNITDGPLALCLCVAQRLRCQPKSSSCVGFGEGEEEVKLSMK
jgi:hypothetical protein